MSKPKQQHPTLSMWVWSLITEFCQTKIATFCLILSFGYTGLSKRNAAKFRELSQNFPKLAGWAVHWQVTLSGCTWDGNFQQWDISFAQPCRMSSLLCTYTSKMLTVSSLSICRQEIERNQAHFVFVHQNPLFSSFLILILWIVTCWPYGFANSKNSIFSSIFWMFQNAVEKEVNSIDSIPVVPCFFNVGFP